jgi:hypothetical protein
MEKRRMELDITETDFADLKALQIRHRWDWPAVFSTNPQGDIWPFVTRGVYGRRAA